MPYADVMRVSILSAWRAGKMTTAEVAAAGATAYFQVNNKTKKTRVYPHGFVEVRASVRSCALSMFTGRGNARNAEVQYSVDGDDKRLVWQGHQITPAEWAAHYAAGWEVQRDELRKAFATDLATVLMGMTP